ncbi:hypothetical protein CDIOL_26910 [Clostridium diolis]|uniref:Uncharacterized protein n=1 Tax=Clostridium diolis TaxID=223919 RepID=A0AAV3VZY7_9CLOT|nr:hypothetical protein CDIOL_26910 [Clostridium diolis]
MPSPSDNLALKAIIIVISTPISNDKILYISAISLNKFIILFINGFKSYFDRKVALYIVNYYNEIYIGQMSCLKLIFLFNIY